MEDKLSQEHRHNLTIKCLPTPTLRPLSMVLKETSGLGQMGSHDF